MSTAIAVLDAVRDSGQVPPSASARSSPASRSSSTPACGSSRRCARCAPSCSSGTSSPASATASPTPSSAASATACRSTRWASPRRSRRTTSSASSSEMLAVTLSKDARARAVQLPAWNEALGLPRPWDQQWSLRIQQVLAYETDLLEYDDLFEGSQVVEAKVAELVEGARAEIDRVQEMGGAVAAVEGGYMKSELVASHSRRRAADRVRRGRRRRRQPVRDDRAEPAHRRPRDRRSRRSTPGSRRRRRRRPALARGARRRPERKRVRHPRWLRRGRRPTPT